MVNDPGAPARYDDGRISCDDDGLVIRWYYPWGAKRIPYASIRAVRSRQLTGLRGKWRLWGSGDLKHWYNLDRTRPSKQVALELDTGTRSVPTITPDDPQAVERIIAGHVGNAGEFRAGDR
jgi:hypothetical protein